MNNNGTKKVQKSEDFTVDIAVCYYSHLLLRIIYSFVTDTMRPYKTFKEKWLWKRIDYDKSYGYQCVDLIKQYADEVLCLGKIWAIGNANRVQYSSTFKGFSKLWVKDLMQWDIIIRTKWKYWHIAIVDHILNWRVYVLEQNGSWKNSWNGLGDNAIRVKDYPINWYDLVLRNKKIIQNFESELLVVNEKIKEYEEKIKITREYGESIRYGN